MLKAPLHDYPYFKRPYNTEKEVFTFSLFYFLLLLGIRFKNNSLVLFLLESRGMGSGGSIFSAKQLNFLFKKFKIFEFSFQLMCILSID